LYKYQRSYFSQDRKDTERKVKRKYTLVVCHAATSPTLHRDLEKPASKTSATRRGRVLGSRAGLPGEEGVGIRTAIQTVMPLAPLVCG